MNAKSITISTFFFLTASGGFMAADARPRMTDYAVEHKESGYVAAITYAEVSIDAAEWTASAVVKYAETPD